MLADIRIGQQRTSAFLLTRDGLNLVEKPGGLPKLILSSTKLAAGWGDLHAIMAGLTVLSTPSPRLQITLKILSSHSTVIFRLRGLP